MYVLNTCLKCLFNMTYLTSIFLRLILSELSKLIIVTRIIEQLFALCKAHF